MAKGNVESFDDVLELARMRRYTGMVTLEHKQGGRVEEGEVVFQASQPIYARVGRLVGQDALNWLMQWRNIYYTLRTDVSEQSDAKTAISNADSTTSTPSSLRNYSPRTSSNSTGPIDVRDASNRNTPTPGIEWVVPQKRGVEREVLALPLTRRQRFVYFLVDGRRTIADLARCTGKNTQEIELILSELREQGLVAV